MGAIFLKLEENFFGIPQLTDILLSALHISKKEQVFWRLADKSDDSLLVTKTELPSANLSFWAW